jgi:spore coat polysaccharide biosynthesis predicted glycosyltransferase SpsG
MRYVLRADASQSIGSGHVMRSSTIAEELMARGEDVVFVGQISEIPWLAYRINSLGFSEIYSGTKEFVSNPEKDILILDSYVVPVGESFIQPDKWRAIVTIADELTPAYEANLIIHPGLSTHLAARDGARVLAGPRYIPFRSSIQKSERSEDWNTPLEILVVGGGTDLFGFVSAICERLRGVSDEFHANIFTNNNEVGNIDSRFTVVPIGSELDNYAMNVDLVFTTASTTSLEFIAREVAVGIGCAVDNQEEYYESLSVFGVAAPIGRFVEGDWQFDHTKITELVHSSAIREDLRRNCSGLIDLGGAGRIVDEISKLASH